MARNMLDAAMADRDEMIRHRRYLHAHAETGFDLDRTLSYVRDQLAEKGIEAKVCGRCGLTAEIGRGGRKILLRADMDALPVREESGEDFACRDGAMHACGHDMHTAMLLEAAKLLKERENELGGRVQLMFQSAEEILQGAADMLENGLMDNGRPDAALMIHVLTGMPLEPGTVIVSSPGISAPAAGMFEIRLQGKGCHGAMPHTGVDPISAAAHLVLGLQTLTSREIAPSDTAMLTIGMLQAGDTANVIPDRAALRGSLRAMDDGVFAHLRTRMEEISRLTAQTFRCTAEVEMLGGCPTLMNDASTSAMALRSVRQLLGAEKAMLSGEMGGSAARSSGSEDFAYISHEVPSVMLALAAGRPEDGYAYPAHHPMTRFDERALPVGAAVYAQTAADFLAQA